MTTLSASAYGFRLAGVESVYLERTADERRPLLTVHRSVGGGVGTADPEARVLALVGGGRLVLDRRRMTADYATREPLDDDELVHPYLAPAASVMAGWQRWDAFHAGAFTLDGAALAVLGGREHGKSTLLAAMALGGADVVTDDVLVVERDAVHVGPRCVDLRLPGAREAFPGAQLEPCRSRERVRLRLASLPGPLRLAGWVALEWGDRLEVRPLRPSQRLHRLARSHSRAGEPRDEALLELARLPGWELTRPRRLELLPETLDRLFGLAAG